MILQALTEYYQSLAQAGKIAAPGWGPVKVSFALYLSPAGTLEGVSSPLGARVNSESCSGACSGNAANS